MQGSYFYIAKVTDNQDEDGLNRIKVTTQYKEEAVSYWLPYLSASAGNGVGFSSLPDIDDQVLVLAMGNSRENQVVIGSFWNENFHPPKTEENADADLNGDGKNSLSFVKSKSSNMIILDDSEGKEKIQLIATGGKSRIDFDLENELLSMESDKNISVSAKGNISIQTEEDIEINFQKSLNIETDNFNVKANKEINIETSKDMTFNGSGIALN